MKNSLLLNFVDLVVFYHQILEHLIEPFYKLITIREFSQILMGKYLFLISLDYECVFELSDLNKEDLIFLLLFFQLVLQFPVFLLILLNCLMKRLIIFTLRFYCIFQHLDFLFINFDLIFARYPTLEENYQYEEPSLMTFWIYQIKNLNIINLSKSIL